MLILTNPAHTQAIADPFVRQHADMIFSECFSDDGLYGEPYDPVQHGYIVVVQPGDTVEKIQEITGIDLLLDPFTGARFPATEYSHCFDICETHRRKDATTFSELCAITSDSGFGVMFIVPHIEGIDTLLLAFCAEFAKPALSDTA